MKLMKENTPSKRDQYTAVLEDVRSNIKVFGEAQSAMRDQLNRVDKKLDSHTEMIGNIMIRLEEIKSELKQKVDYQDFFRLEKRVVHLEARTGRR